MVARDGIEPPTPAFSGRLASQLRGLNFGIVGGLAHIRQLSLAHLGVGGYLCAKPVETASHIGHARGDPDLRSSAQFDHLRKLSKIKRNSTGSAPLSTLILALPGSSM
jgi:hypothetical protein